MLDINKFNKIIVANWKMNGSIDFIHEYLKVLKINTSNSKTCGVICPPTIFINIFKNVKEPLFLGSQDCSIHDSGPFTGETSSKMLNQFNCRFSIVGHSERRKNFQESNDEVRNKAERLIKIK